MLLHLVREMYPDVEAVFSDTGLEYLEIKEFVRKQDNVTIIRPDMSFRQVVEKYGYPLLSKEHSRKIYYAKKGAAWAQKYVDGSAEKDGNRSKYCLSKLAKRVYDSDIPVSAYCCIKMKELPIAKWERHNHKRPYIGMLASESRQREQKWIRTGCNAFGKNGSSNPLSFWTEQDILRYIKENNIEICSVYGQIVEVDGKLMTTGCDRTGCVFCMYGCHLEKEPNRFQRLKNTHPKLWEYCMRDWDKGGLGIKRVLEFIGAPWE